MLLNDHLISVTRQKSDNTSYPIRKPSYIETKYAICKMPLRHSTLNTKKAAVCMKAGEQASKQIPGNTTQSVRFSRIRWIWTKFINALESTNSTQHNVFGCYVDVRFYWCINCYSTYILMLVPFRFYAIGPNKVTYQLCLCF